jgi:aryl-alcohol dehydrogenase-like predicted oxidoreductase
METIKIGDFVVRRFGFGAMRLPGKDVWGEPDDPARARAVVRRAIELGINFIDSSWYYGPHVANKVIAEALYPYPSDLVIASKLGGRRTPDKGWAAYARPDELRIGCEHDLRELRRDVLDIVHFRYIGGANTASFDESLDALIDLQREGKIRHLALSNVNAEQLSYARAKVPIVAVQNLYNLGGGRGKLAQLAHAEVTDPDGVLAACEATGTAFLPFFPLSIGQLATPQPRLAKIAERYSATPAQLAIAWLLARSPVMLPIPGTSRVEHLEENWKAQQVKLTAEDLAEVAAAHSG